MQVIHTYIHTDSFPELHPICTTAAEQVTFCRWLEEMNSLPDPWPQYLEWIQNKKQRDLHHILNKINHIFMESVIQFTKVSLTDQCMFSMSTGYFTTWLTDAFKKHRGMLEINKVHINILSQAHINIWWSWSADSISSDVGSRDVTPFHPSSSTNHLLKAFSVLTRSPFGLTK